MLKFGSQSPRSLNSFGVAGLLEENGHVLYDSLSSLKHIGRLSDLICARVSETQVDDLKLRTSILLSAYQCFRTGESAEPLTMELGFDESKIVIGMSFLVTGKDSIDLKTVSKRISEPGDKSSFDELLLGLKESSDLVVLRGNAQAKRYEIMSILSRPGQDWKIDPAQWLHVVEVPSTPEKTPAVKDYVELGDVDYVGLLKEEGSKSKHDPKEENVDFIVKQARDEDKALQRSIRGRKEASDPSVTVISAGEKGESDSEIVFRGGRSADMVDQTVLKVGGGEPGGASPENIDERVQLYQLQVSGLQNRIRDLEAQLENRSATVSGTTSSTETAPSGDGNGKFFGFFKKMFNRSGEEVKKNEPQADPSVAEPVSVSIDNDTTDSPDDKDFDTKVKKIQGESTQIKQEVKSDKAKQWIDGLVGDLISERAKVKEFSKKLSLSSRQRELEFRNKEKSFVEELKRKDEAVLSKEKAMMRLKDQLTHANMALERAKSGGAKVGQESQWEKKYNFTRTLLATTKEENEQLKAKLDESRSNYTREVARAVTHDQHQKVVQELNEMKRKADEAIRHGKELQSNYDALNASYKNLSERSEEYRRKINQAMTNMVGAKQEIESLRARAQELETQNINLSREIQAKNGGKNAA